METIGNNITGWTRLYHPAGAQVTIPIPLDAPIGVDTAQAILASVSNLLEAGWAVDAPGLEEGEQKQEVVSVSRRESKDGTPVVAFYLAHPKTVKKFLHAYLNKPEDVQAFEAATGLKLESIPCWMGERDIDRDHREAGKYIIPLPRPIQLVWTVNPKWQQWSAEGGKSTGAIEPHKRLLVRYDGSAAPAPAAPAPAAKPGTGPLSPAASKPAAVRKYGDGTPVKDEPQVQAVFDLYVKQRGQAPMSAEGLKAWYSAQKNKAAAAN